MFVFVLLLIIAFSFIILSAGKLVGEYLLTQRLETQQQKIEDMSKSISDYLYKRDANGLFTASCAIADAMDGRALVLDMNGIVLSDSSSELNGHVLRHPEVEAVITNGMKRSYGYHRVTAFSQTGVPLNDHTWAVYYTQEIQHQSRSTGVLLVSVSIQDLVVVLDKTISRFVAAALFTLFTSIFAVFFLTERILSPINSMAKAIKKMSAGQFDVRVNARGSSEVAQLGKAFNAMSEQLAGVEKQRQDFVANASHELRTPLSAIKILTESLLYQDQLPEAVYKEFLGDINSQIDRLKSLIDDLLQMVQYDGNSSLRYTTEDALTIVEETYKILLPLATEKNQMLTYKCPSISVRCDRIKLQTALINLVSNAIKYTPDGGCITIEVAGEDGWISFSVEDTGIGIPESEVPHVFERFYRVDKARSRAMGGTGLGLSIVQHIARLHAGNVGLVTKENVGSTFILRIPQWEEQYEPRI